MAEKTEKGGWGETLRTLFWALLIAVVIRTLFFQPFWIPSGSMKDTLLIGDYLFINKMAYGYSRHSCPFSACTFIDGRWLAADPERGDVAVFKHPVTGDDFIKRIVGLPGDTVQVADGRLILNGRRVPLERDGTFTETFARQGAIGSLPQCANAPVPLGGVCEKPRFRETLPAGTTHNILKITDRGGANNTAVFTVPEGQYFVLGDNRDNSRDSRFPQTAGGVGMVPAENLLGRADRVMFSAAGRSLFFVWTWRGDRFFKRIE